MNQYTKTKKYNGFKRPCRKCHKYFKPTSKANMVCCNCQKKSHEEAMEKLYGPKHLRKKNRGKK